jgi:alpha-beta hydrolase superfamily lysophospholipase
METENTINDLMIEKFSWKNLENKISVAQYPSTELINGISAGQIYIKKHDALKKDPARNITIFLLHDLGQYHGRYNYFINWTRLNIPGISFVAIDFVGHGLSSGTRGHFEHFDSLVTDVLELVTGKIKNNTQNEKWLIMGHGLGGIVALDLLNRFQSKIRNKIDGIILSNFILKFDSLFLQIEESAPFRKLKLTNLISHSRPLRFQKSEDVLICPTEILKYEQDPLIIHRPTLNVLKEIQMKMASVYQDSYFLDKPMMLLTSVGKGALQKRGIDYFAKGIKKDLLREKKYTHNKHDLYNDSERVKVFEDIMDWIKIYEN